MFWQRPETRRHDFLPHRRAKPQTAELGLWLQVEWDTVETLVEAPWVQFDRETQLFPRSILGERKLRRWHLAHVRPMFSKISTPTY